MVLTKTTLLSAFLFLRLGQHLQCRPTEKFYHHDSKERADTVNSHITQRGPAAIHEGLMIFIQPGKTYADCACCEQKQKTPQTIDIKGKGYGHSKTEILCHMGDFSNIRVNFFNIVVGVARFDSKIYDLIGCLGDLHDFVAYLVT